MPFSGSNVPEAIELLNASGAVTQTLMLSTNQVGSVQLVTDAATGEVTQRIEYDEFGRVLTDSAPGLQPFGFAGGLYDQVTKLVRFGARDYSAEVGRWIARDVIRFRDADNLGVYSGNDPINEVDPTGFGWFSFIKCVYYDYMLERDTKDCKEKALKNYQNKPFKEWIQDLCDDYGNGEPNQPRYPSTDYQKCNEKSEYYSKKVESCARAASPAARIPWGNVGGRK